MLHRLPAVAVMLSLIHDFIRKSTLFLGPVICWNVFFSLRFEPREENRWHEMDFVKSGIYIFENNQSWRGMKQTKTVNGKVFKKRSTAVMTLKKLPQV